MEPRLYTEFADWWPILSSPEDYAEAAGIYHRVLTEASRVPVREVLELGSGGGNNASHLKAHWRMTLVDRAPGMLAVSRRLNPECEHAEGDMRTVRLGRTFDAVFVHDAVSYIATVEDLRKVMETARVHLRPGGAALFCPDHDREDFRPSTKCGGHDAGKKGLRYVEWAWDPDPSDTTYLCDFAYLLREESGEVRAVHDRHVLGLFPRADWLRLLEEAGFEAQAVPFVHTEVPEGGVLFLGGRP